MSRKPKDEVAASTTITLRLTPDDRERVERLIRARGAELPEPSMSALLRRLVREAEGAVVLRVPDEERAMLDHLVSERSAELARLGVYEAQVTASSVLVGLIREAARGRGVLPSSPSSGSPSVAPSPEPAKLEAPAQQAAGLDRTRVRSALLAAIEGGTTQADIARRSGVDAAQVSKFCRLGTGLSPDRVADLAKALESST